MCSSRVDAWSGSLVGSERGALRGSPTKLTRGVFGKKKFRTKQLLPSNIPSILPSLHKTSLKIYIKTKRVNKESSLRPALLRHGALFRSEVVRQYLEFLVGHNFYRTGCRCKKRSTSNEETNFSKVLKHFFFP